MWFCPGDAGGQDVSILDVDYNQIYAYLVSGSTAAKKELEEKGISTEREQLLRQLNVLKLIDLYRRNKDKVFADELKRRGLSQFISQ